MIDSVVLEGLATGPVTVGGPTGPVEVSPDAERVVAVFSLRGWNPQDDEAVGHRVLAVMETIGNAIGDDRITPQEAAAILSILDPRIADRLEIVLELAEKVFAAISDDGRISRAEGLQLVLALASSVLRRV